MQFTYESYVELVNNELRRKGEYTITTYQDWNKLPENSKCVILRHDIDTDVEKAEKFSRMEKENGIKSTYFVLLTSDFYNVFSKRTNDLLLRILDNGHDIGLHFDETRYPNAYGNVRAIEDKIIHEAGILGDSLGIKIQCVSMHRPSKAILDADIEISGIINSYSSTFFREFKYLSDSRKNWREPVDEIVRNGQYKRLHILTHAFWYDEIKDTSLAESVKNFISGGDAYRYEMLSNNITDLKSIITLEQCLE